jgi:outer membrane biogenesis lipoprotein LolB
MGIAEGFGEVAVLAARATLAGLVCLLLAACTGGNGSQPPRPGPAHRRSG